MLRHIFGNVLLLLMLSACSCKKSGSNCCAPPNPPQPGDVITDVEAWVTTGDQFNLFKKQNTSLTWTTTPNANLEIVVDSTQQYQTIDGFGYTLTGGSADVLMGLSPSQRAEILKELFSTDSNYIGVSYLRVSIGASDLSASVFSYDDMPAGQTDPTLQHFSLSKDTINLVPVLKEILAINGNIKILGSPWSAPAWMKDNESSVGGKLLPAYYGVYADYIVKYIQAMAAKGITIDAVTIQNEPEHGGNNPSMLMSASEQADFIKNHLGPKFQAAGINTKIIIWDHNCDNPNYPITVLNDPAAKQYIDGSAFHLYGGNINALTQVYNAHPDRNLYFTEQYTASNGDFAQDLRWHLTNVIVGSMRNYSRVALEWNLANNPSYGPHTPGGCTVCKGALTIGSNIQRNVAYYIIAHASKFVRPGSVRVHTDVPGALHNVAFVRPDGKKVLIVVNDSSGAQGFNIKFKNRWVATSLDAGAVGTYVWD
jgi:O-Glycosyl hydrolase